LKQNTFCNPEYILQNRSHFDEREQICRHICRNRTHLLKQNTFVGTRNKTHFSKQNTFVEPEHICREETEHICRTRTHLSKQNTFVKTEHICRTGTHLSNQNTFVEPEHISYSLPKVNTHVLNQKTFFETEHEYAVCEREHDMLRKPEQICQKRNTFLTLS